MSTYQSTGSPASFLQEMSALYTTVHHDNTMIIWEQEFKYMAILDMSLKPD